MTQASAVSCHLPLSPNVHNPSKLHVVYSSTTICKACGGAEIHDYFDVICGTSTGAILSGLLGVAQVSGAMRTHAVLYTVLYCYDILRHPTTSYDFL